MNRCHFCGSTSSFLGWLHLCVQKSPNLTPISVPMWPSLAKSHVAWDGSNVKTPVKTTDVGPFFSSRFKYPLVKRLHCLHNCGKSPCFMGKSTISMAIFNSYVKLPEGIKYAIPGGIKPRSIPILVTMVWGPLGPGL